MNDLLNMELFSLLTESSQKVSNNEMKNAYENFVNQVQHLNQSENDYDVIYRTLNLTRIELIALQAEILYEQEKKMLLKFSIVGKQSPLLILNLDY